MLINEELQWISARNILMHSSKLSIVKNCPQNCFAKTIYKLTLTVSFIVCYILDWNLIKAVIKICLHLVKKGDGCWIQKWFNFGQKVILSNKQIFSLIHLHQNMLHSCTHFNVLLTKMLYVWAICNPVPPPTPQKISFFV